MYDKEYKFLRENSQKLSPSNQSVKSKEINLLNTYAAEHAAADEDLADGKLNHSSPSSSSSSSSISMISNGSSLKFEINQGFMRLIGVENPFEKLSEWSNALELDEDENKNVLVRKQSINGHSNEVNGDHTDPVDVDNGVHLISHGNVPILTNTTLNVIRLFGKYIHMLSIFKIISHQVITYLMQLFQFYFYYIYLDFTEQEVSP